jgi:hypothetical protein
MQIVIKIVLSVVIILVSSTETYNAFTIFTKEHGGGYGPGIGFSEVIMLDPFLIFSSIAD